MMAGQAKHKNGATQKWTGRGSFYLRQQKMPRLGFLPLEVEPILLNRANFKRMLIILQREIDKVQSQRSRFKELEVLCVNINRVLALIARTEKYLGREWYQKTRSIKSRSL